MSSMIQGNVFVSRSIPNFAVAISLGFHDQKVAVNRHDGIDFRATGFERLSGPDIADSGEIIGLR